MFVVLMRSTTLGFLRPVHGGNSDVMVEGRLLLNDLEIALVGRRVPRRAVGTAAEVEFQFANTTGLAGVVLAWDLVKPLGLKLFVFFPTSS